MSDLLNKLLKQSMEREAKKIASSGATEKDRYGHLLDNVRDRNIAQEEIDKYNDRVSRVLNNAKNDRLERDKKDAENARKINRLVRDVEIREQRKYNDFLNKHKTALDKGRETIKREQNKNYFS